MNKSKKIIIITLLILYFVGYGFIYVKLSRNEPIIPTDQPVESHIIKYNNIEYEIGTQKETDNATKIPVITYHRIADHKTKTKYFPNDEWVNDAAIVDSQLEWLYNNGWKTVNLDTFYEWMNNRIELPSKTFVITVDDGDIEAYYNLLPILEKYNFEATLFAIGSAIPVVTTELNEPERTKLGIDIITELRENDSLLHVESHSYNMHYVDRDTGKETPSIKKYDDLVKDFEKNDQFGFKYMAYPYGAYTDEMLKVISESNIKMAFIFKDKDYARRSDNIYEVHRLKVNGQMTLEEFKTIFLYVK